MKRIKRKYLILLVVWLGLILTGSCSTKKVGLTANQSKSQSADSLQIKNDPLIKDEQMAVALAEPILFRRFGKKHILRQKPYRVKQINNYWIIQGYLPAGSDGGVFEITLDGNDGKIIKIMHGQ
ncbi:hypothetical protein GXP67_35480 [Rhodocytophaga rosea]|uniref:NTF2 fold domain-containing protein n=1 Tax=Rhodocytophaga rosea TaxID=2704465 RepID=A0A6C0GTU6_9BACT|nr:YbbC/YhhH family protein [Rhodocytophaga rosea]QHT71595.1 hypothetical protein GXP67_35480 [Rhodocytophaga rosea]